MSDVAYLLPRRLEGMKPVYHTTNRCTHITESHEARALADVPPDVTACHHCPPEVDE